MKGQFAAFKNARKEMSKNEENKGSKFITSTLIEQKQSMLDDIYPRTPHRSLEVQFSAKQLKQQFDIELIAAVVGMQPIFIRRVLGKRSKKVSLSQTLKLLELDAFSETFVPRSRIPEFLLENSNSTDGAATPISLNNSHNFFCGNALSLIPRLPSKSIQAVVTSTPYWGMRIYEESVPTRWADGQECVFGHEQTPEGFIRHSVEVLYRLKPALKDEASVWWNLMDTYNTRTQIRGNASETLNAMKGNDDRGWSDHQCRRYSSGHSYLEDGEQCMIPARIATRASRIGYFVRSTITWKKSGSLPETVRTRVTRELEYVLHLTLQRSPYFDKDAYLRYPTKIGGKNPNYESDKITDVWFLSTAAGQDGHGAQFPLALPGRCIALSTREHDLVLDPFVGSGTTSVAAKTLGRRSVGFDVSKSYIDTAKDRLKSCEPLDITRKKKGEIMAEMWHFDTEEELVKEAKRRGCNFVHRRCNSASFHRSQQAAREHLCESGEGSLLVMKYCYNQMRNVFEVAEFAF